LARNAWMRCSTRINSASPVVSAPPERLDATRRRRRTSNSARASASALLSAMARSIRRRECFERQSFAAGPGPGTEIERLHHDEADARKGLREVRAAIPARDDASRQRLD
jgi:hypothetical protein